MALTSNNVILSNTNRLAVKIAQTGSGGGAKPRLDGLHDVREANKSNNNILVYNSERDLWILQEPEADGGSF